MAADLESLIRQVWGLEADDLRRLRDAIDARIVQLQALPGGAANAPDPSEEIFKQRLLDAGLIKEIRRPSRDPSASRPWRPVPIEGKPLSETIIEERR